MRTDIQPLAGLMIIDCFQVVVPYSLGIVFLVSIAGELAASRVEFVQSAAFGTYPQIAGVVFSHLAHKGEAQTVGMFQRCGIELLVRMIGSEEADPSVVSPYPDVVMAVFAKSIYGVVAEAAGGIILVDIMAPFVVDGVVTVQPLNVPIHKCPMLSSRTHRT